MDTLNEELLTTAVNGDIVKLKLCLQNGADINYQNEGGWTALMEAAYRGYVDISRFLLDSGCDKDLTTTGEWTALIVAANKGHLEVTTLLIDSGCDKNYQDNDGRTALHVAAQGRHLQVIIYLIEEAGMDPMITTTEGKTAYDLAAVRRRYEPSYQIYNAVVNYLEQYR